MTTTAAALEAMEAAVGAMRGLCSAGERVIHEETLTEIRNAPNAWVFALDVLARSDVFDAFPGAKVGLSFCMFGVCRGLLWGGRWR